jgi:small GTP-binding protein
MSEFTNNEIKLIIIGKSGVGKTSLVNKWTKNKFIEEYKATIASEFGFKIYEYEGKYYRIQLWDIAGQDNNSMVLRTFAKNALGAIIVCDAKNIESREE